MPVLQAGLSEDCIPLREVDDNVADLDMRGSRARVGTGSSAKPPAKASAENGATVRDTNFATTKRQ